MASLVESVILLERQASELIETARKQAKAIETDAEVQIELIRKNLSTKAEERIAAFRAEVLTKHAADLEEAERQFAQAMNALKAIPADRIEALAERVAARFCGV